MEQFKKKNRWRQRDRHSRGSCPQYQAPAWWVGGWVERGLTQPRSGMLFSTREWPLSKKCWKVSTTVMGANRWDGGEICSDSAVDCGSTSPLWATNPHWSYSIQLMGKRPAVLIPVTCFSQLLPLPRHTSARWQPLSPGSLQNSTTSRHVVSGVMGTSVTACSPSLRYTVNIIWEITIQSWGLRE